jgi:hypothetical protein
MARTVRSAQLKPIRRIISTDPIFTNIGLLTDRLGPTRLANRDKRRAFARIKAFARVASHIVCTFWNLGLRLRLFHRRLRTASLDKKKRKK